MTEGYAFQRGYFARGKFVIEIDVPLRLLNIYEGSGNLTGIVVIDDTIPLATIDLYSNDKIVEACISLGVSFPLFTQFLDNDYLKNWEAEGGYWHHREIVDSLTAEELKERIAHARSNPIVLN